MRLLIFEFIEAWRIALAQIRAHRLRAALTALGVVIGIVAVTLMGAAIAGINRGFAESLGRIGDDNLFVQKWPWSWTRVDDWWNYADRPPLSPQDAVALNRIIAATPRSLLRMAVPVCWRASTAKAGQNQISQAGTCGTSADFAQILLADFQAGRFFTPDEAGAGQQVAVLGYDIATALFPGGSALDRTILVQRHPFQVIGVLAHEGTFLGMGSYDSVMFIPIGAFKRFFQVRTGNTFIRVQVNDQTRLDDASEELAGAMRRVRGQLPGERDNFSINQIQTFKGQINSVTGSIAIAGLFVTGLALFVGAVGIMNVTFVSVKERTREIGTRKALGARRRAILMQFLIEAVSICVAGGVAGLAVTMALGATVSRTFPRLPLAFSPELVAVSLVVATATGIVAGFAPAWGASRLDPVVALRYE